MKPSRTNRNAKAMAKGAKNNANHPAIRNNHPNVAVTTTIEQQFSGPLPHPQILAQYDKIIPGCANKIISAWEEQAKHRQDLERKVISADIRQSYLGLFLGFIIAIAAIGAGTFLAYIGRPAEGIAAIISALVGLIGAYGWGSYQRRKERTGKIK